MYTEYEKKPTLGDLIGERIFDCKKDIRCKEGVFAKGSLVYLTLSPMFFGKLKLYEVDNWNETEGYSIFCCPSDCSIEDIDIDNFNDFFSINEKATLKFKEIGDEEQKYISIWSRFVSVRDFLFKAGLIMAVMATFLILCIPSVPSIKVIAPITTLAVMLLGLICHIVSEIIYNKKDSVCSQRRIEVINAAKEC